MLNAEHTSRVYRTTQTNDTNYESRINQEDDEDLIGCRPSRTRNGKAEHGVGECSG